MPGRNSPSRTNAGGGKILLPGAIAASETEQDEAYKQQIALLPWHSLVSFSKLDEARVHGGPFTPGGGVFWGAKDVEEFGAAGHFFPGGVPSVITKEGAVPLSESGKKSPHLSGIDTKFLTSLGGKPTLGSKGLVFRGAKVGSIENLYWISAESSPIVSHWHGKGANSRSSTVYDISHEGDLHPDRQGPLDVLTVVTMSAVRGEFVPVLNGAPDRDPEPESDPEVSRVTLQNSGGGTSTLRHPLLIERIAKTGFSSIIPTVGVESLASDPLLDSAGYDVINTPEGGPPGGTGVSIVSPTSTGSTVKGSLRFIEEGPFGPVHVGHGSDMWMVDGDSCIKHRYASTLRLDIRSDGTSEVNRVHECSGHHRVGEREGVNHKLKGSRIKDAPWKHSLDDWDASPPVGKKYEGHIKYDPKDFHIHRGIEQKGLWKLEYQSALGKTNTPGPKLGDPVDPLNCAQPIQVGALCPNPTITVFGESSQSNLGESYLNDIVWTQPNDGQAPYTGGNYGWAKQLQSEGFDTSQPAESSRNQNVRAVGGFLNLPNDVFPTAIGSKTNYNDTTAADYTGDFREDINHYRVYQSWGRPDPVKGQVVDGFRFGVSGDEGSRQYNVWGYDTDGDEDTGLHYTFQTRVTHEAATNLGTEGQASITGNSILLSAPLATSYQMQTAGTVNDIVGAVVGDEITFRGKAGIAPVFAYNAVATPVKILTGDAANRTLNGINESITLYLTTDGWVEKGGCC